MQRGASEALADGRTKKVARTHRQRNVQTDQCLTPHPDFLADGERLLRAGQPEAAAARFRAAADNATDVGSAHVFLLQALLSAGRREEASKALDALLDLSLSNADLCDALAFYARQLDRHELSNELYRKATGIAPGDAQLWLNLATSDRSLGRLDEAARACDRAIGLDQGLSEAVFLRSEVTRATETHNHIGELSSRLAESGSDHQAIFLLYALGKELHELGLYDAAFEMFSRGAAARRQTLSYDVRQDEAKLARIAQIFSRPSPAPIGSPIGRHIFIIGLPRSGTTLTERILGGLAGVRSNNETENFSRALLKASPAVGGDVFARAGQADYAEVAADYESRAAADGYAGRIVEKLPLNYLYVGPILQAFPTTPIILLKRHPLDSCFAMYRTLFGVAYPFTYDFEDLARYYAAYQRLMSHWLTLYGDRIISVDYERLVSSPGLVGREIAERCGLQWSAEALDLTQNRAASLTASAAQVRGSIYGTSSGLWRRYANHLRLLLDRLRSLGVDVPE